MTLIDTNILVYAVSPAETVKMELARGEISRLIGVGQAVVSIQNCTEFMRAAALKPGSPLELVDAHLQLEAWSRQFRILSPDFGTVELAIRGVREHRLSFWDSMIWGVCVQNEVDEILSEDGPSGSIIEGVRFTNPFLETA